MFAYAAEERRVKRSAYKAVQPMPPVNPARPKHPKYQKQNKCSRLTIDVGRNIPETAQIVQQK
jgi:hypothetical protein